MQIKFRYTFLFIFCLSAASAIFSWDGSYEGGDIAGARRSFLGQNPIDLWGGFSGFFYGNIPNFILPWGLWLLLLQLACASTGIILISKHVKLTNKTQHLIFIILSYLILSFSGYLTRDSTMASFYILGFGLILFSNQLLKTSDKAMFFFGTSLIILAVAFRPWLFFASLIPAFYLRKYNLKNLVFALILVILPFCIDRLTYLTTEYKKVHPELQVVISDVASMTCLSSNNELRKNGTDLLNNFSNTFYSNSEICGDFRLNTWQSVGSWSLKSSVIGLDAFNDVSSRYSKILISSDMTTREYTEIRNSWLKLLANNPKDYLQVKLIHANQVMISGDTFGLRILNADSPKDYIAGIFFIPFDIAISLHLLSPALTFLIGFIIIMLRFSKISINNLIRIQEVMLSYLFVFCWVVITSIAYIGDNGRYTYLSSFIFYICIFLGISRVNAFPAEKKIYYKSRASIE
jgi:hypothetical protein